MISYISDFDQLSWLIDLEAHKFFECKLGWGKRHEFKDWLEANIEGDLYIWNGNLDPVPNMETGWGKLIAPDGGTFFLIFLNTDDATKFALQYTSSELLHSIHRSGVAAYHNRRGS